MDASVLRINYEDHRSVQRLLNGILYTLEGISIEFDQWEDTYAKGPGLYVAVIAARSIAPFADPMGANEWPIERCRDVSKDLDVFYETASEVAFTNDGAVVVSVDGVVQEQMVRFRDITPDEIESTASADTRYEDWMGARHMSALDTSKREPVVSTLTLSEETGRVTLFNSGSFITPAEPSSAASGTRRDERPRRPVREVVERELESEPESHHSRPTPHPSGSNPSTSATPLEAPIRTAPASSIVRAVG